MNDYQAEAYDRYGKTKEYLEYKEKTKNLSKDKMSAINEGLMAIISLFAKVKTDGLLPSSQQAQELAERLKSYISQNYYTCTDKILLCLGKMYVADERFTKNIDKFADGTAEFVSAAIEIYCRKEY